MPSAAAPTKSEFCDRLLRTWLFTACLSVEHVRSLRACIALFQLGRTVRFSLCLRLLGTDGFRHAGSPTGWPSHERVQPCAAWILCIIGASWVQMVLVLSEPLARIVLSDIAGTHGHHPVQEGGHHRWQHDGLGWCSQRSMSKGELGYGPPATPHQLSGTFSSVSIPETLSSIPEGPSCPRMDGQHYDSGLHQSSGGLRSQRLHALACKLILWSSDRLLSLERGQHMFLGV